MNIYIDGVLTPPADAGSLDGIPAALQPVGPGEDGHVVTYVHASGDLELKPGGGGGMVNPMNAVGNLIVGGAVVGGVATPTRLAIGTAGYILRAVGGTPVWRELFDPGTSGTRPGAASTREGQWYWSTDAAAGLEMSVCTHQGGGTYAWVAVPYGVTATGAALVQAADAAAAQAALFDVAMPISGFTADGGTAGGSATAATGILTLPAATATSTWAETPRFTRALAVDPFAYEVAVRLVAFTNGTNSQQASLRIAQTPAGLATTQSLVLFRAFGDGGYDFWTGSVGAANANYSPGVILFDGLTWVRVRYNYGLVTLWTGRGATYAAAVWTLRYCAVAQVALPVSEASFPDISLTIDAQLAPFPSVATNTVQWSNLVAKSLP